MPHRKSRRIDSNPVPAKLDHNNCSPDVDHEGDEFCSLKFRGDLLKTHVLYIDIGGDQISEKIHEWVEEDCMRLALAHFKEEEIDNRERRELLAFTLGCARSTEEVLKLVDEIVKLSTTLTGLEDEGDGGPREKQFRRVAMTVRNVANAGTVPGSAAIGGAESKNMDTPWKHKAAACLLISMVMDLFRSPKGYFAMLVGGKSMKKTKKKSLKQHVRDGCPSRRTRGEIEAFPVPQAKKKRTAPKSGVVRRRKPSSVSEPEEESGSSWSETEKPAKKKARRSTNTGDKVVKSSVVSLLRDVDKGVQIESGQAGMGGRSVETMVDAAAQDETAQSVLEATDDEASETDDTDAGEDEQKIAASGPESESTSADILPAPTTTVAKGAKSVSLTAPLSNAESGQGKRPNRRAGAGAFSATSKQPAQSKKRASAGTGSYARGGVARGGLLDTLQDDGDDKSVSDVPPPPFFHRDRTKKGGDGYKRNHVGDGPKVMKKGEAR